MTTKDRRDGWIAELRAEDRVFVTQDTILEGCTWREAKIVRITPTGRLRVHSPHPEFEDVTFTCKGKLGTERLRPVNPGTEKEFRLSTARQRAEYEMAKIVQHYREFSGNARGLSIKDANEVAENLAKAQEILQTNRARQRAKSPQ